MQSSVGRPPVAGTGALLVRGSALGVLNLVAGVGVGFFLMPFLIHSLGDRWYGIWTLIGSITSYYALLDLGLTSAVNRFLTRAIAREEPANANAVIVTGLVIFGGIGALILVVSVGVAIAAGWFVEDPAEVSSLRQVIVILGADVALALPLTVFNALLVAHYRFDTIAWVQLGGLAFRAALIVWFVSSGHSILTLALITFAVGLISRLGLAVVARRMLPSLRLAIRFFDPAQARELFGYGKYTFIAGSADRIRFQIDTLVIGAFLGVAVVTHYAIATRLAQYFMELMMRALGVVGPVFVRVDAHGDIQGMRETFLLATRLSVLASVTIAGSVVIFGDRFIQLWIGEDYRDAYGPLVILTGSLAVALMQLPSVSVLFATARHRFYAGMNSAEALANLVLSLALVQHYGMLGVSVGTAVPLVFTKLVVQPRYVCGVLDLDLHAYYREISRMALIAAISLVPLGLYVYGFGIASFPVMAAIALCYYSICWTSLIGTVLTDNDRRQLRIAMSGLGLSLPDFCKRNSK